jgi:hypothetical protein
MFFAAEAICRQRGIVMRADSIAEAWQMPRQLGNWRYGPRWERAAGAQDLPAGERAGLV